MRLRRHVGTRIDPATRGLTEGGYAAERLQPVLPTLFFS